MNLATKKWVFLKLSSIILIPLMIWFIINFISVYNGDYSEVVSFFSNKTNKFIFSIFLILFNEAFLSPAIKHNVKVSSVLKSKLFTIAPTSQFKDDAASKAVLAEEFNKITFKLESKFFKIFSTLFTGSLSSIVIIQLKIVSFFPLKYTHMLKTHRCY